MNSLDDLIPELKSGEEKLAFNGNALPHTLLDFWKWSVSDILSNATRGRLAEFIVATAAKIDIKKVRDEWGNYDLETEDGIKIEVKSSAYLQSWQQNKHSNITFGIKQTKPWDWEIDKRSDTAVRSADVYVFCLLHHKDKPSVDPLNMNQWEFYVLATEEVNRYQRSQHSISLNSLKKLTNAVDYEGLGDEIMAKANVNKNRNVNGAH